MKLEDILKLTVELNVKKYQECKTIWDMRRVDIDFYEFLNIAVINPYKRLQYETMYETNKRLI